MSLPSNVGTGLVVGRFTDGAGTPLSGGVTFTPAPAWLLVPGALVEEAVVPTTVLPEPVEATLSNGVLAPLELLATDDPDVNPQGWTWQVSFTGGLANRGSFDILVPEGQTVDLTVVAPVASTPGVIVTQGRGVPPGGTTGQSLVKVSGDDYDTEWATVGAPSYSDLTDVPATFPPASHDHDDRYYTESEADARFQPVGDYQPAGAYATPGDVSTASTADRQRSNHTGTQPASSIADLQEVVEDFVGNMLVAGGSLTLNYDDATGKVTITGSGGDAETIRDTIGAALVGTSGVQVAVNDAADTITLTVSGLSISQVTGLQTALDGKAAASHTHPASQISDATTVGRNVVTAADAAAARTAIGAGTSDLALGTTSTTAKAGNYQPTAANISDSTATGRAVLTAADAAAARAALGVSPVPYLWSGNPTVSTTATAYVPTAQTLTSARMRTSTAPAGSALTVVLQRSTNDGGAWTDLVTLSIAAGSTTQSVQSVTTALSAGDLLRLNVTSVGSTTAATGVSVEVYPA